MSLLDASFITSMLQNRLQKGYHDGESIPGCEHSFPPDFRRTNNRNINTNRAETPTVCMMLWDDIAHCQMMESAILSTDKALGLVNCTCA